MLMGDLQGNPKLFGWLLEWVEVLEGVLLAVGNRFRRRCTSAVLTGLQDSYTGTDLELLELLAPVDQRSSRNPVLPRLYHFQFRN